MICLVFKWLIEVSRKNFDEEIVARIQHLIDEDRSPNPVLKPVQQCPT